VLLLPLVSRKTFSKSHKIIKTLVSLENKFHSELSVAH